MIEVRKFSFSDLKEVMEIERISFPDIQAYSENRYRQLYQEYPQGFIVAQNTAEIVGYAFGQIRNNSGEIISIAVTPEYRRKGIGIKLIEFLFNNFQKEGIKLVSLHVRESNKIAILFFEKLGFRILKKNKNYYRNGNNAFLMARILGK